MPGIMLPNIPGIGMNMALIDDANNQQTSTSDSSSHVQASYSYDGLGNRVMKQVTSGPTTVYVYDAFGQMAAEYTNASSTAPCITCYLSYDHLGSVRMVTDQTGSHITALHDYFPFGEEIPGGSTYGRSAQQFGATDGVSQRFTGQQRDSENSPALDFFNARYFTAALGRFGSPDPANAGADLLNPQSWNGYGYVLGNPLGLVDPSGMGVDFGGIFQAIGSTLGKLFGLGQDESDSSGDIYDCAVGCTFYDSTTLSSGGRSSTSSSKTPPSIPLPPPKTVLATKIQNVPSACLALFNVTRPTALRSARAIKFYNGRTDDGNLYMFYGGPWASDPNYNFSTIDSNPYHTAFASTLLAKGGLPSPNVVLWKNYYAEPVTNQAGTLFHEWTHVFTKQWDLDLARRYHIDTKPFGGDAFASSAYDNWLQNGPCR